MMERPDYIYTDGSPLQHTPMHLDDAEMYGFLIKGDKEKLQATVDMGLNKVAGDEDVFRVLTPYVLLTFTRVNHAQSGFEKDHDRGWGKECDIIPWVVVGQMDDHDGAARLQRIFLYPSYTWVDVATAISIGREIFGYPKSICKVDMPNGEDDPKRFSIDCEGWQPFGDSTQLGEHPLIEIEATDTTHEHVPIGGLRELVTEGLKVLRTEGDLLSLDLAGVEDIVKLLLDPHIDQLFLKQFPDASGVKAVYQAIVTAPAVIDKVHSARLLGYGYTFTLHQFDTYRLDQTLGFQLGAQSVLFPFHISMDFTIKDGEELFSTAVAAAPQTIAAVQAAVANPADKAAPAPAQAGQREKIAVLGGGPAAMTAVFYLTDQEGARDRYDITVYQMGWRLGGKCASGRNAKMWQRIEEHGLHLWFGFYSNGFDLMQKTYGALNRPAGSPLATWQDAFKPHNFIVLTEPIGDTYKFWSIQMPPRGGTPGAHNNELTFVEIIKTLSAWVFQWVHALDQHLLQGIAVKFKHNFMHLQNAWASVRGFATRLRDTFHELEGVDRNPLIAEMKAIRLTVFNTVKQYLDTDDTTRHFFILIDLATTTLIGMHDDGVMFKNFDLINDVDFRTWLTRNGANAQYTVDSAPVRGLYDLVFAYSDGDPNQPNIEAGTLLRGLLRLAIDYHGGFLWKMQAGMGDTVFTPLHEVLKRRGVKFKYFHKVEDLVPDGDLIDEIHITRQVTLKNEAAGYDPYVTVGGLDCWPSRPLYSQIVDEQAKLLEANDLDLESHWSDWAQIYKNQFKEDLPKRVLKRGTDFDKIIFGLPIATLPHVCPKLLESAQGENLKKTSDNVKTAATKAYQVWLNMDYRALGWKVYGSSGEEPVMSSFSEPFDTATPMNQLLQREDWNGPPASGPKCVAYFCSPIHTPKFPPSSATTYPSDRLKGVRDDAIGQLTKQVFNLWPSVARNDHFDWTVLTDPSGKTGQERFDSQYWRVNVNPSDLYVLSVVDSSKCRIKSDESGFSNLYLAGDWLNTGLNAGCVEGAVMGGMQASRAMCGYPKTIRGEVDH